MRLLLIAQHTCIHVLAVSIYSFDSLPIINSATASATWARWWWLVIIIRYRVSCGVCVDHGVVHVVCCSLRVYMAHEMVQSVCWACCWLLTGQDSGQRVCGRETAGDFEFPFGILFEVLECLGFRVYGGVATSNGCYSLSSNHYS